MDTNKLLRSAGINDPAAFKFAVELARQGHSDKEILEKTRESFNIVQKIKVNNEPLPYAKFGEIGVDIPYNALEQIDQVMRLPLALRGALMPDAHYGYAMPIGGVVGLLNAVSPSFVGYDIACRMMVSFLDISPVEFMGAKFGLFEDMKEVTRFGLGVKFDPPHQHEVMDDPLWDELPHLKNLKSLAASQLGTSGGGNHFFDLLIGQAVAPNSWIPSGKLQFVAIMSHSGSRGVGHKMATYYQKLAKDQTQGLFTGVPKGYEWLRFDSDAGREYWNVMQLMGRYAQANHQLIHDSFLEKTGIGSLGRIENHHNFAWLEDRMVVHRKGATPAAAGQIGIIPGSSGTASFLVEGLGNADSLNSSSHGAGRPFSRTEAKKRHDEEAFMKHWKESGVLYDRITEDETYQAYKDIERVISIQDGVLVRVVARMMPEIVIMGGKADDGD
ncbi:RtcB family protein [bacterium]|nr:RtcB family protein [bacterium]